MNLLLKPHPDAVNALKLLKQLAAVNAAKGPFFDCALSDQNNAWRVAYNCTNKTMRDAKGRPVGEHCAKVYRDERLVGLLDLRHKNLCEFFGGHANAFCRALRKYIMAGAA